jgi:hypothetical protein
MLEELRGEGWRALGYFLWMLGAGIVLDGDGGALATLLLVAGAAAFLGGWMQILQSPGGQGR